MLRESALRFLNESSPDLRKQHTARCDHEVMLRDEYELLGQMGNLSDCNVPEGADSAWVWAIRREFELRRRRLARESEAHSIAA